METLGDRIKMIRKEQKMTQEQFGAVLGVSGANISYYEHSEYPPSTPVLNAIAEKFGINREWLLTGEGEPRKELTRDEIIADLLSRAMVGDSARDQLLRAIARLPEDLFPAVLEFIRETAKNLEE